MASLETLVEHKLEVSIALVVLAFVTALLMRPKKKVKKRIPEDLVAQKLKEFSPAPLCPEITPSASLLLEDPVVLESSASKYSKVQGVRKEVLNLSTMDFLGMGQRKEQRDAALGALNKYGCGSCGPRGFYGTIDVHVFLEEALAKFFKSEACVVYSDEVSTVQSVIPAFANKSDILVVDDACNDNVISGVILSRAQVHYFKHNDMEDLEKCLQKINAETKTKQRRFVVVEGIYRNSGDICMLDKVVELKSKYKWRLFVDETISMFVLGKTGRGVTEHFDLPNTVVELSAGSLNTSTASIGGFSVGRKVVVDHQKLYGAGYVFSASCPPFVSSAAIATIELIDKEGEKQLAVLSERTQQFHDEFDKASGGLLVSHSSVSSPLIHLVLGDAYATYGKGSNSQEARYSDEKKVHEIAKLALSKGVLVRKATYVKSQYQGSGKGFKRPDLPSPSLKVILNSQLTKSEVTTAVKALVASAKAVLA